MDMNERDLNFDMSEMDVFELHKVDTKLLRMIYKSVFIFKDAIENKTAIIDDKKKPFFRVSYPVKVIWDNINTEGLEKLYDKEGIAIYGFKGENDNKINDIVLENENVVLFKESTGSMVAIDDGKKKTYITDTTRKNLIRIVNEGKAEIDTLLNLMGKRDFVFPFDLKTEENEYLQNMYFFKISGLFIDLVRKTAEYYVDFGIEFLYTDFDTVKDMPDLWDKILDSIDRYVEIRNKHLAGKLPSKDLLSIQEKTFAVPSHPIMFTLLAMFAGRPERIPRKLLQKPYNEMSENERKEADNFLNSIIEKEKEYNVNKDAYEEKRIAVVSDNPRVEAKAEIGAALFADDLIFREGALALYIKRAFGAEGLRHLLGLLIGLEEGGRDGTFEWSINDHLKRLGYKKHRGTYKYDLKKTATEIVKIFTSLFITARSKSKKGVEVIEGQKLFSIDGFKQETFNKVVIDETINLRATDFWYRNAFQPKDGSSPKFTKLLYKIAQENHREHPLTIYLAPLFAVFWRINHEGRRLKLDNLIDWCDIRRDRRLRQRIRELEKELDYMKDQGYLGEWSFKGDSNVLSECKDPLNAMLDFYPPNWLSSELQLIASKKEQLLAEHQHKEREQERATLTREQLEMIITKSGLSNRAFAQKVGISPSLITRMLKGERKITKKMSGRIREHYDSMLA